MPSQFIQVVTTVPTKGEAERIALSVMTKRLTACVQISGPVKSIYRWKGKLESAREWVCTAKTRASLYGKLEKAIREMHPYNTPEIIAMEIVRGSGDYLKWLRDETHSDRKRLTRL